MYRQYDGYPSGHGAELADFLTPITLVNGISMNETRAIANGMGCLAAQLVCAFKTGAGGIYLQRPKLGADSGQEYEYHVFNDKVVAYSGYQEEDNIIFEGTWGEFKTFCKKSI